jgi:broad specificity phosphatase PhoE
VKTFFFLLSIFLMVSALSAAPIVVIVRHAEKVDNSQDAELSPAGRQRAENLAQMLKDGNITAIFTSEFKRTQQTAAPTSRATGVAPMTVPAKDLPALISKLHEVQGNALVVGHGNTIPDIVKALGIETPVQIADDDYSEIFVVTVGSKPQLLRMHYP